MDPVVVRAPTRIDFGGGWTDVPPYSLEQGGTVCNIAIDRCAQVRLEAAPAGTLEAEPATDSRLAQAAMQRAGVSGIRAVVSSDFPSGAGLGGSSAIGVALAGALRLWRQMSLEDRAAIAEESRDVEVHDAGIPGGRQDHYAAAFGGALELTFGRATTVRPLELDARAIRSVEERCLVFYTGQSRISGDTISAVLGAYTSGDARVAGLLSRMRDLAGAMALALADGDIDTLGGLVGEHWQHQRGLHPAIPTPRIDEVLATAARAGALGGKALGASGGGCVVVIAREGTSEAIRQSVGPLARPIPFAVDVHGVRALALEGARDGR